MCGEEIKLCQDRCVASARRRRCSNDMVSKVPILYYGMILAVLWTKTKRMEGKRTKATVFN